MEALESELANTQVHKLAYGQACFPLPSPATCGINLQQWRCSQPAECHLYTLFFGMQHYSSAVHAREPCMHKWMREQQIHTHVEVSHLCQTHYGETYAECQDVQGIAVCFQGVS